MHRSAFVTTTSSLNVRNVFHLLEIVSSVQEATTASSTLSLVLREPSPLPVMKDNRDQSEPNLEKATCFSLELDELTFERTDELEVFLGMKTEEDSAPHRPPSPEPVISLELSADTSHRHCVCPLKSPNRCWVHDSLSDLDLSLSPLSPRTPVPPPRRMKNRDGIIAPPKKRPLTLIREPNTMPIDSETCFFASTPTRVNLGTVSSPTPVSPPRKRPCLVRETLPIDSETCYFVASPVCLSKRRLSLAFVPTDS